MSELFGRRWSIDINGKPFIEQTDGRQFKMQFTILIDFGGSNNYADLSFFNISSGSFKEGDRITFKAGYIETVDTVFIGTIQNVLKERQEASTITRLVCRSQRVTTFINKSYGAGVDAVTLIKACVNAMDYPAVIDESQFANIPVYTGGFALQGDPRVLLDRLARTHGFTHTVENGRRVIVRNGFKRNTAPFVISQFTGMEGIPQITEVGADVTMRLSPKLRIGGTIDIRSELSTFDFSNLYFQNIPDSAGKGIYRIQKIEHSGDSWGDVWSSKVTAIR